MKARAFWVLLVLGLALSACEPEEVEIEEDSYAPTTSEQYVLAPRTFIKG